LKVETNIITITAETITGKSVILIDIEVKTFKTEVTVNWLHHNVFDVALTDNFQYHPYQSVRNFQITNNYDYGYLTVIQAQNLYIHFCLSVNFDSLSCLFTSIAFLTNFLSIFQF
jgi:hypothetical protein